MIRKIVFVVILFLISTSAAFSQGFEWGVKAGMNVSFIRDNGGLHAFPGFYAGVAAEQRVGDRIGVQGELLFSETLESTSGWEGVEKGSAPNIMDYLVLPVMVKYYAVHNLSLELGPQFGYLLQDEIARFDRKFDLSLGAGVSYKISRRFDASIRYNWGLTRLTKDSDDRNNTFRLGAGYRF